MLKTERESDAPHGPSIPVEKNILPTFESYTQNLAGDSYLWDNTYKNCWK